MWLYVSGRPGIKGSCGKRRMRLKYLTGGTDDVAGSGLLVLRMLTLSFSPWGASYEGNQVLKSHISVDFSSLLPRLYKVWNVFASLIQ